jgi:hypothetical protein
MNLANCLDNKSTDPPAVDATITLVVAKQFIEIKHNKIIIFFI